HPRSPPSTLFPYTTLFRSSLKLQIGDVRERVRLEPTLRPELASIMANVKLPDYLERTKPIDKDIRGGAVALVHGSKATFTATARSEERRVGKECRGGWAEA